MGRVVFSAGMVNTTFKSESPEFEMGTSRIVFSEEGRATIIRIDGTDLLEVEYNNRNFSFDVKFYSLDGTLIGEICDNKWSPLNESNWKMKSEKHKCVFYNQSSDCGLKIETDPDTGIIKLIGMLHCEGRTIYIHQSRLRFPDADVDYIGVHYILGSKDVESSAPGASFRLEFAEDENSESAVFDIQDGKQRLGGKV